MLRHQWLPDSTEFSILRFYGAVSESPYAPFDAVCTLMWRRPDVWVFGFHGNLTRALLHEFVQFLVEARIQNIRAFRSEAHVLPRARMLPDGSWLIPMDELQKRFSARLKNL